MTQSVVWRAIFSVTLLVFSSTLDPRNAANAATEPVLVTYQESNWTDSVSGAETTPSIAWQAADVIVVVGATEDSSRTLATPTAPGLTFSLVNSAGGTSNVNTYLWSAVAGGNGSGAVSSVKSSASAAGISVWVYRGSTGIGNNAKITGSTAKTISLTRSSDSSAVVLVMADWIAATDVSVTSAPAGGTIRVGDYVVDRGTFWALNWPGQGAPGTASYGITNHTGTVDMSGVAVEIKGLNTPPPPDTTAPTISISAPAGGASVSGNVTITANASDNVGVAGVQFFVDGNTLSAEDTTAPYSITWSSTSVVNGSHTLSARARDAAGNITTSAGVTVTVNNAASDTTPPTVSIMTPAQGATVSSTVSVSASAADNVGVAGVQFLLDGNNLGAEDTSSPYSVSWNTTSTANGAHTLTARARDAAGNQTVSASVGVTVNNVVTPPGNNWSINGSQTFQTMDGFGVNINSLSWKNGESRPAIDLLADGMGAKTWRVVFDEMDWESTNDDGNPNNFNWTYYNALYGNAKFQHLWGTLNYLNQKGFTTNVALSFMGIGPSWMGANGTVTTAMEDEMVETIASLVYYARNTAHVTFGILNPFNEPLWDGIEGPMLEAFQLRRILNKLAVKLDALGLSDIRFMAPETAGGFSPTFVGELMSDPVVMNKIDHISFHQYGGDSGGADSYIKGSAYPNKTFWVTEVAEPDAIWSHIGQGPTSLMIWEGFDSVYNHAIRAGRGTTAPNDTQGLLNPPVAYNASTGTYSTRSTFHRDAAIFKFVGPGATRISSTESISSISSYTYYNASTGRFTITGRNTSSSVAFNVTLNNLPPISTVELYRADTSALTKVSDIAVTNNTFSFTAPANTYFTLTGLSGSDATAPSVAITAPANGATVSGTAVVVSATSSDNVGVAGVQFKLDGANLGAEDTTAPYSVTWNSTTASIGSHQLTAVARDAAGNAATSSAVTVTVPDTVFPTAAMTAPANGSTAAGTILVSANASDNVGVAGVQFLVDGVTLGAEDTTAPYNISWNTIPVANGSHTLSARARDAAGNVTTSTGVTVTVANDTTFPSAAITAPAGGSTATGTINVTANASDNVGVVGVQFLLDGGNLGAEDTVAPYSVSWDTTPVANGSHVLSARARDAAGNATTSTGVTVTVANDGVFPTVAITAPASGSTASGTIDVTATASDNVGVTGVQFMLDGVDLGAEDTAVPYSISWDTTTLVNGAHTLSARARDAAGNATTSAGVPVTVSNTPPPPATATADFGVLPTEPLGPAPCLQSGDVGGPTDPCAYKLHQMTPGEVTIATGGLVTFQVHGAGHAIAIYEVSADTVREGIGSYLCPGNDPATITDPAAHQCGPAAPEDISVSNANALHVINGGNGDTVIVASANVTNVYPDNRVWYETGVLMTAGGQQFLNGGTLPAGPDSNGEVVKYRFFKPGRYLVICMNRSHFLNDWMFGFVTVVEP